jgi:ubiquinone biosynthesis protein Coq4
MGDRAGAAAAFSAILAGTLVMNAALFRQDRITHVFRAIVEGWTRGREADAFFAVHWEEQWDRPLAELRAAMHVAPSRYSRPDVALAA